MILYFIYIYIYIYKLDSLCVLLFHDCRLEQFAKTSLKHSCINRNLRNFIELLTVMSGLIHGF